MLCRDQHCKRRCFRGSLVDAFGRSLESELNSQLHLARSSIVRLGRDRAAFDCAVPKIFGRLLSDEHHTQLFAAYSAASAGGAATTRPGARGKSGSRQRPPKAKPRQQVAQLEVRPGDGVMRVPSPGPLRVPIGDGSRLPLVPRQILGEPLKVDVASEGSNPTQLPVGSAPWKAPMALGQWRAVCGCCSSEDTSDGSWNQFGFSWCRFCYRRHEDAAAPFSARSGEEAVGSANEKCTAETQVRAIGARNDSHHGAFGDRRREPGGPAIFYDRMEPVLTTTQWQTAIGVEPVCCLHRARQSLGNPCLLVTDCQFGSNASRDNGGMDTITRASTLWVAVDASAPPGDAAPCTPPWGGIYVPDVLVFADSEGEVVEPWRLSMIYARMVSDLAPEEQSGLTPNAKKFLLELREKILNVMRISLRHGHDELILGAWGCGRPGVASSQVAEVFRDVFREVNDVSSALRRVTFAILPGEDLMAFQSVFGPSSSSHTVIVSPAS